MFVAFEGIDGSGKTTQLELAATWLRGKLGDDRVVVTRAPGGTEIGSRIRDLILSENMSSKCELLLFAADRVQQVEEIIKPALAAGKVVLSDRYNLSTLAYQFYWSRDLDSLDVIAFSTAGILPDLNIWLDCDVSVASARLQNREKDRIENRGVDYYRSLKLGFDNLFQVGRYPILRIEADESIEQVAIDVKKGLDFIAKKISREY